MDIVKFLTKSYLNFSSLIDFIKFIVPIIATYLLTKYTANNPRKREISQQQFIKVYLPLYKIFCIENNKNITVSDIKHRANRLHNILQKNYELAFPQLHDLSKNFTDAINNNANYQETLEKISYQISIDYEILKKKLGYPHLNHWELFKRLTTIDKSRIIFSFLSILSGFPCIVFLPLITTEYSKYFFISFIFFLITSFIAIIIDYKKSKFRNKEKNQNIK